MQFHFSSWPYSSSQCYAFAQRLLSLPRYSLAILHCSIPLQYDSLPCHAVPTLHRSSHFSSSAVQCPSVQLHYYSVRLRTIRNFATANPIYALRYYSSANLSYYLPLQRNTLLYGTVPVLSLAYLYHSVRHLTMPLLFIRDIRPFKAAFS